jgi:hypothetical protein
MLHKTTVYEHGTSRFQTARQENLVSYDLSIEVIRVKSIPCHDTPHSAIQAFASKLSLSLSLSLSVQVVSRALTSLARCLSTSCNPSFFLASSKTSEVLMVDRPACLAKASRSWLTFSTRQLESAFRDVCGEVPPSRTNLSDPKASRLMLRCSVEWR